MLALFSSYFLSFSGTSLSGELGYISEQLQLFAYGWRGWKFESAIMIINGLDVMRFENMLLDYWILRSLIVAGVYAYRWQGEVSATLGRCMKFQLPSL